MKDNITSLLQNFLEGNASPEEIARLNKWYEANESIVQADVQKDHLKEKMYQQICEEFSGTGKLVSLYRRSFFRIAIAACFITLLSAVAYYLVIERKNYQAVNVPESVKDIFAPTINRATITLADGRSIYLDSAINGELITQENTSLIKLANGQIAYKPIDGKNGNALVYNTLVNPRGSRAIAMTLADDTMVWLNSESSITYPVAFIGNERMVSITGEAYFEVMHDKAKPFYVSKGNVQVKVLGTHFNVNAHEDEDAILVTLLEGSIKVSNSGQTLIIKPGEQARIVSNQSPLANNLVNVEEVMAWKNDKFIFNAAKIETVMRQLARWYDVDVEYRDQIASHFTGIISRSVNASQVFAMLEKTGAVRFEITGKKMLVMKG